MILHTNGTKILLFLKRYCNAAANKLFTKNLELIMGKLCSEIRRNIQLFEDGRISEAGSTS